MIFRVGKSHTLLESRASDRFSKIDSRPYAMVSHNSRIGFYKNADRQEEMEKIALNTKQTLKNMRSFNASMEPNDKIRMTVNLDKPCKSTSIGNMNPNTKERKGLFMIKDMIKQNKKRKLDQESQMYKQIKEGLYTINFEEKMHRKNLDLIDIKMPIVN